MLPNAKLWIGKVKEKCNKKVIKEQSKYFNNIVILVFHH